MKLRVLQRQESYSHARSLSLCDINIDVSFEGSLERRVYVLVLFVDICLLAGVTRL